MSNLVTLEHKKSIMDLGYPTPVAPIELQPRDINGDLMFPEVDKYDFHLTVSDALDWIRENKGVVCFVDVIYHPFEKKAMYLGKILSESGIIIQKKAPEFDTHPLASSELLTVVLNYLIEKEK